MTLAEEALVAGSGALRAEIPFTEYALIDKPVQHDRQRWLRERQDTVIQCRPSIR